MTSANVDITQLVPAARLARYRSIVGSDLKALEQFYKWAHALSLALFSDIAALEVTMRTSMARELSQTYGSEWYVRQDLFDDDAARSIVNAWRDNGLGALRKNPQVGLDIIEGKLVAGLTFGFWVQLLGRGSHAGKPPLRQRRIYDTLLWKPALTNAFPLSPTRSDAERHAAVVRTARNRIAHHEHIAWGVPLPGQHSRLSVSAVHDRLLELAGYISPQTADWINTNSRLEQLVTACPVNAAQLSL